MRRHSDRPPHAHERDELTGPADARLARAVAALRHLPDAPPDAVDRVVAAALVRNGIPGRRTSAATWLARAAVALFTAGLGASAALYGVHRAQPVSGEAVALAPEAARAADSMTPGVASNAAPALGYPLATGTVTSAAARSAEDAPVVTPFALVRPNARHVAIMGDFTGWKPAPMTRDARGAWTTDVPLTPGRHAYVFVVDDTLWVTDPRSPVVRDADYGRDQSIILVGRP